MTIMKITEKTTVTEAINISKEVLSVFKKYNLDCPGCKGAGEDTIKIAAINNGLELESLLMELNSVIQ